MGKPVVAVFDSSREYVNRFLGYVKGKRGILFEAVGFTEDQSLEEYLSKNRVQILLYSQEEFVEEKDGAEGQCEKYIGHSNVGKFIYLGTRRNSRSRLKHIAKYQSMENILSELNGLLELRIEDHRDEWRRDIKLIGIYSPAPDPTTLPASLRIAGTYLAEGSTLYINLDRFPLLDHGEKGSGISDLIFFYRTNKEQITAALKRSIGSMNGFDLLCASCDMEDMEELRMDEWQDFLYELAIRGEYDVLILDMYEAFRNLEEIFSICDEIFILAGEDHYAKQKTDRMKQFLSEKGRSDLFMKMNRFSTEDLKHDFD